MPYVSQAQAIKFHADPKLRKYVAEYDAATPNINALPARASRPKHPAKRKHRQQRHDRLAQMLAHAAMARG